MANLNKLILPIKNQSSGEITNQEFNLSSGGGSTLSKLILPVKNQSSGEITNQEFNLPSGGGSGTSITPSNSSPVSMTGGETYTPTINGVAVESVTDITPSTSSPPALSAGNIYKPGSSGYAIDSYSNISPSSSGTYFSSGMKKMSSSGYAYSSKPSAITKIKELKTQFTSTGSIARLSIYVSGFSKVVVSAFSGNTNQRRIWFYDSNGNLLSSDTSMSTSGGTYTIPSGTSYVTLQVSTQATGAVYGFNNIEFQ